MYLLLAIILIGTLAVLHAKKKYSYWSNLGIPGPTPIYPLGSFFSRTLNVPLDLEIKWMRKYGKFYGIFNGLSPVLVILDPVLIKQIMIKDFPHFINRFNFPVFNELWNQNLLFSSGEQWKRLRTITTPAFTSGKLRAMHSLMNRCVTKLVTYFDDVIKHKDGIIDTKEVIIGFTIDVIASTTFATETDANNDRSKANPVVTNGRKLFTLFPLRRVFIFILPKVVLDFFGIKDFLDPVPFDFFTNLIKHVLSERKNEKVLRNDLVQLFLEAKVDEDELAQFETNYSNLTVDSDKKDPESRQTSNDSLETQLNKTTHKKKLTLTESEIIAQCIFIFAAGFETTATTISHVIFELAQNGEIQEKLFQELNIKLADFQENSEKYFDAVMNSAVYLNAVIKETLRKYPPVTRLNRMANTDGYELNGVKLFKNQWILMPCAAIHYCPDFYPEPEVFNPDRFLPENYDKLVPYTFLPFGLGPRNCVGIRFAYQEIKLCLALIVRKFRFETTPTTPSKLNYKKGSVFLEAKKFPIKLTKRF